MATPRGLTQPYTSFISSSCQGIHRVPLTKQHTHKNCQRQKTLKTKNKKKNNSHPTHTTHSHAGTMKLHRVHYTVLTQHTPPPPTTHTPQKKRHKKSSSSSKATRNTHMHVPDTQQHTNTHSLRNTKTRITTQKTWCASSSQCHKPQHQPHPPYGTHSCRGGMLHPDYKKTNDD